MTPDFAFGLALGALLLLAAVAIGTVVGGYWR